MTTLFASTNKTTTFIQIDPSCCYLSTFCQLTKTFENYVLSIIVALSDLGCETSRILSSNKKFASSRGNPFCNNALIRDNSINL